nr:S24 family peptidase [Croceibacterium ferulae]
MSTGERIRARRRELSLTQKALAQMVGLTQPTIGKLESGEQAGTTNLDKIARVLQTTAAYLRGDIDDSAEDAFIPPTPAEIATEMGLVRVNEIDLDIGMGASFLDESHVTEVERWVPQEWVAALTSTAAPLLTFARPFGDSMYPTINDRDIILIDRSERRVNRQEAVWALSYSGMGMIKRVRVEPDGTHRLMADNPQVRDATAADGELFVIGRVVGVVRRM